MNASISLSVVPLVLLALVGCETTEPSASGDPGYDSGYWYAYKPLYERLGGEPTLMKVVDETLARAAVDPVVGPKFEGANVPLLRMRLIEMLGQITGGPQVYGGQDMESVHRGMGVTNVEFDSLAEIMLRVMTKLGVGRRERREVLTLIAATRSDIVTAGEVDSAGTREALARIEARLASLEARIAAGGTVTPGDLTGLRPTASAPIASAAAYSQPTAGSTAIMPAPEVATSASSAVVRAPIPLLSRSWLPEEMKWSKKLVERFSKGRGSPSEARSDLLGHGVDPSRLLSDSGRVIDLADYRGKKVVLVILRGFQGQVCLHCSSQTLALTDRASEFASRGAQVILLYPGAAESVPLFLQAVRQLRANFEPPFPIGLDVQMRLVKSLAIEGSLAKPTSLILDPQGNVTYAHVGKVPSHRPTVDELLSELDRVP